MAAREMARSWNWCMCWPTAWVWKLSLLPFNADANMNDALRNTVCEGHYLGYGPTDLLMHVPVDRPLMDENPQVSIFALC